jgi:hypothetical protein
MVALASLRFPYSLLFSEYIKHIQVFGFFPLPLTLPCEAFPQYDPCPVILLHLLEVYTFPIVNNAAVNMGVQMPL